MNRSQLIEILAIRILQVECAHPVRVGIDGVDGVGKTSLADELADELLTSGRQIIRASVDGFHNPRSLRYRLGRNSPEGYFRYSFNYPALITALLDPLGPNGSRRYRRKLFNYKTDSPGDLPLETATEDAILLFDGVFLHRRELVSHWDLSIFLDAPFSVTIARTASRDGCSPAVNAPENRRYIEGQELYLRTCEPTRAADIVVNNKSFSAPELLTTRPARQRQ